MIRNRGQTFKEGALHAFPEGRVKSEEVRRRLRLRLRLRKRLRKRRDGG